MTSSKRKQKTGSEKETVDGSHKRRRTVETADPPKKTKQKTNSKELPTQVKPNRKQAPLPKVNKEPAPFPRGGAGILTPLEKKQIRAKAHKDALIEDEEEEKQQTLFARKKKGTTALTFKDLSLGMILPGRVTKTTERHVLIQLGEDLVGRVGLIDLADDYDNADPMSLEKNKIVRACVVELDTPNKRIGLSLRPSRVTGSSLTVRDPEITSLQNIKVNDVVRGFVANVADVGLFVMVGHAIKAFVRVSNISDSYIVDWKDKYERDQLVLGKVISVDAATGRLQLTLKESAQNPDYVAPTTFRDLKVGQVVTGSVVRVEDFGVFILLDNSSKVRGLCHRSKISKTPILDARQYYNEGDTVKAKILRVNTQTEKLDLGLRASYFDEESESDSDEENAPEVEDDKGQGNESDTSAVDLESASSQSEVFVTGDQAVSQANGHQAPSTSNDLIKDPPTTDKSSLLYGLQVSGFDWNGLPNHQTPAVQSLPEKSTKQKSKSKQASIFTDHTSDLATHGPQSAADFERLLLTDPSSSLLWLQYMALHLSLGDPDTARSLAQRAIRSIPPVGGAVENEKLNIWVALLNLENTHGDASSLETAFAEACRVLDPQDLHERLASIYIQSGKPAEADALFQTMLKKFGSGDPKIWINYATFLFDTVHDPDRARALLARALQTLPETAHVDVTAKFAGLEFRSPRGTAERGRTIFEGLLDGFPKRVDLWSVLLDLEINHGDGTEQTAAGEGEAETRNEQSTKKSSNSSASTVDADAKKTRLTQVRRLFERIFSTSLKGKQAKFFFKRWLEFEEKEGDVRRIEAVKKRAEEWVRDRGGKK